MPIYNRVQEEAYNKKAVQRLSDLFDDAGIGSFDDFFTAMDMVTGWFEGYFMNSKARMSLKPTPKNIQALATVMRAINAHYPVKRPQEAYRVTLTKARPTDEELLGRKQIAQPRKVLSFSTDLNAARNVYAQLHKSNTRDMKEWGDQKFIQGTCWVIIKVRVTSQNFLVTHRQCAMFLRDCAQNWDYFVQAFGNAKREDQVKKLGVDKPWQYTVGYMKSVVRQSLRPFIVKQKEAVLQFPTKRFPAEVVEVLFNGGRK
jgi:hypothetical protein